jgi:hypothetical protein
MAGISSILIIEPAANASQCEMNSERIWAPHEGRFFHARVEQLGAIVRHRPFANALALVAQ